MAMDDLRATLSRREADLSTAESQVRLLRERLISFATGMCVFPETYATKEFTAPCWCPGSKPHGSGHEGGLFVAVHTSECLAAHALLGGSVG
jgi:hypothetical protein